MSSDLIVDMQRYVAHCSVGISTVRGQRTKGLVKASRRALQAVDLVPFGAKRASAFADALDAETLRVRRRLPRGARSWGLSRKLLNIFLRGALYNIYLREQFRLNRAEPYFEVALDKWVACGLIDRSPNGALPRWRTIKGLRAEDSQAFQARALDVARGLKCHRVHLDMMFWLDRA